MLDPSIQSQDSKKQVISFSIHKMSVHIHLEHKAVGSNLRNGGRFFPSASNLSQQRNDPYLALEPRRSMYLCRSAMVNPLQLIIETPLLVAKGLLQYREMGKLPGCQIRSTDTTCMSNLPRGFNQG